jgi:phospholipid transport system substrate-binding protein
MRRRFLDMVVILIVLLVFPNYVRADTALETIQTQVNRVLEVLRDPALKGEDAKTAKAKQIESIANDMFNYTELSKRTLGRNWRKFNPQQQKEFIQLFSKVLEGVYMDRILEYSDEEVVFLKELQHSKSKAEVQSQIITASKTIPINYRMLQNSGTWKVYDVVVEGVSLIKNYRSQFNQLLRKEKPEDLLQKLRDKVQKSA